MSTTIREINGKWTSFRPSDASNVSFATQGNEVQIRWGVPLEGSKGGLGFAGTSPPSQTLDLQTEFILGTLRHFNQTITGVYLTNAVLEVELVFDTRSSIKFNIEFEVDETPNDASGVGDDFITAKAGFPTTVSVGNVELEILGFRDELGNVVDSFSSPEDRTNSVNLIAKLVSSPSEEEHCVPGAFDPVFDPQLCNVDPICPIGESAILDDCGVPLPPDPMTDCPDIDMPAFVGLAEAGSDGDDGQPGPKGDPGPPGCTPVITASYQVVYVHCLYQRVSILSIPVGVCSVHFHFIFYLCLPYYYENDCCIYIWCNGSWSVYEGGANCYLNTTTSTTEAGGPTPLAANPVYPPTVDGRVNGETITVCPCDATTTPPPCEQFSCGPCGAIEGCLSISFTGRCNCGFEATACYNATTGRYTANSIDCAGDKIEIFCDQDGWKVQLTCQGDVLTQNLNVTDNGDGTCSFVAAIPVAGVAGGTRVENCCPDLTDEDFIDIIATATKCDEGTTTTYPPTTCLQTACGDFEARGTTTVTQPIGSSCTWGTSVEYNIDQSCWVLYGQGCSNDAKFKLCCVDGAWRIVHECGGSMDTVFLPAGPVDNGDGTWTFHAVFSSEDFLLCYTANAVDDITIDIILTECEPGGPGPDPDGCIECTDCDGPIGGSGTVTVNGLCCNNVDSKMTYNNISGCWHNEGTICNGDKTLVITACCEVGGIEITVECGANSDSVFAGVITDDDEFCRVSATFLIDHLTDCCPAGPPMGEFTVDIEFQKCCDEPSKKCLWTWRADPLNPGGGFWVIEPGDEAACPSCFCNTPPPNPGVDDGDTEETEADCP